MLITGCTVADSCVVEYVPAYMKVCMSVSRRNWHNLLYGGAFQLEMLLCGNANFHSTYEVEMLIGISV